MRFLGLLCFHCFAEIPWADAAAANRVGPQTGYPKARCLDGSPGLYYFGPGRVGKFFIFHEGGGFCGSDAECSQRAGNRLGSTKWDSDTMDLEDLGNLKFSRSAAENPLMHDWNHIYVRYCDGGYYSGYRDAPKDLKGNSVFFSGRYITEAVFHDLQKYDFGNATDVVISGCSAGAIHVVSHLDSLRMLAPMKARVVGLADSGFYMDIEMFTSLKRYVITEMNGSLLDPSCLHDFTGAEEKCLVGSVVSSYVRTPLFAFQSRFDLDQRGCEMPAACSHSPQCIKSYASNLTQSMTKNLQRPHGYFIDSCERHCAYDDLAPLDAAGTSPLQAFAIWYGGGEAFYGQPEIYPCSECCSSNSIPSAIDPITKLTTAMKWAVKWTGSFWARVPRLFSSDESAVRV